MRIDALSLSLNFETITCCSCGLVFAVPAHVKSKWIAEHTSFYCPSCQCSQSYSSKTEEEKLRARLRRKEKELEWQVTETDIQLRRAKHSENRRRAEKGAKTKLKKRINNGVCPCCNRSFENLRRHIATKHKDYLSPKLKKGNTA